ncbi:hypothetical protein KKE92_04740 [Candidatus Micrarchaeota archaeon]|nr:hypothetical protein [Candidatus Micrarchaeota archaeon]
MFQQRIRSASKRGVQEKRDPKLAAAIKKYQLIAELRGTIEGGDVSAVCKTLFQNPDQIRYVFGALIDPSKDLSRHAEFVIARLAQSNDPVVQTHLQIGLSNFLSSPWISDNASNLSAIELRIRMSMIHSRLSG